MRDPRPDNEIGIALSPAAERERHRNTILLIVIFSVIHFGMLTLRVATVGLQFQAEIAQARAFLTPFGALLCYGTFLVLRRMKAQDFIHQAAVGAILSAGAALLHGFVWSLFLNGLDPKTYKMTLETIAYQSLYWYLFYFSWTTAYLAMSYSITTREHERRFTALVAEAQEAKIRALRYQINPHFLFNALNSIAELIAENREQAEKMVLNLSEFFRTSLAINPTDDVRLADEIELQKLYLDMERVRFPERLSYSVDVPPELADATVPSLILQPLVENAVKHGIGRSEGGTQISISARRDGETLLLSVGNQAATPFEGGTGPGSGPGVGLDNVRNRLSARYGDKFTMTAGSRDPNGFAVEIAIPLEKGVPTTVVSETMPLVSKACDAAM